VARIPAWSGKLDRESISNVFDPGMRGVGKWQKSGNTLGGVKDVGCVPLYILFKGVRHLHSASPSVLLPSLPINLRCTRVCPGAIKLRVASCLSVLSQIQQIE